MKSPWLREIVEVMLIVIKTKFVDFCIIYNCSKKHFSWKCHAESEIVKYDFHRFSTPYVIPQLGLWGLSFLTFSTGPFKIVRHTSLDINCHFRIAKKPGVTIGFVCKVAYNFCLVSLHVVTKFTVYRFTNKVLWSDARSTPSTAVLFLRHSRTTLNQLRNMLLHSQCSTANLSWFRGYGLCVMCSFKKFDSLFTFTSVTVVIPRHCSLKAPGSIPE